MTRAEVQELLRSKLQPANEPHAVRFIVGIAELAAAIVTAPIDRVSREAVALAVVDAVKATERAAELPRVR